MFAMGMVTFFCLCANVLATVAWFTSIRQVNEENSYFGVEEQDDAKIDLSGLDDIIEQALKDWLTSQSMEIWL